MSSLRGRLGKQVFCRQRISCRGPDMHPAIRAERGHTAEPSRSTFFAAIRQFGYRTAQGIKALWDKCGVRWQRSGLGGERVAVDAGHTWPISRGCARRPVEARVAGWNYSG